MKKQILILSTLLLLVTQALVAQTIKWGSEVPVKNNNLFQTVHSSKYIYCVYDRLPGWQTDTIRIFRYNKNLELDKILAFKEIWNTKITSAEIMGEDLYLFCEDYSKSSSNRQDYIYYKIKDNASEVSEPVIIASMPTDNRLFKWDFTKTSSGLSNNKQYFGMAADIFENNKKDKQQKLQVVLYDNTMTEKWRTTSTLPYERNLFKFAGQAVDDLGRVYVLAKVYFDKEKEVVKDKTNYKYVILVYKNATDAPVTYDINLDGIVLSEASLVLREQSEAIFTASYGTEDSDLQGIYYLKLDADLKMVGKVVQSPFKPKIVEVIEGEKAVRKNWGIAKNFALTYIVKKSDGGLMYILEKKWQNELVKGVPLYHTDEVVVNNISPTGELKWSYALIKKQHHTDKNIVSFGGASVNGKLSMLFNIHSKFYTKDKEYRFEPTNLSILNSDTWVQLLDIGADGKAKGRKLITLDKKKQQIAFPNGACETFNNELILPVYSNQNKTISLVKITF